MPALKNGKREAFAVALAGGKSQAQAYREAYGRDSAPAASTLAKNPLVRERVEELQRKVEARQIEAIAAPVIQHEISKERILSELSRMAFAADDSERIGPETKRKALVDLAKVAGYIVEKRETARVDSFEDKTDDELRAIIAGETSALGRRPQGAGGQGDPGEDIPPGRPH
jgi:hypothetical protein